MLGNKEETPAGNERRGEGSDAPFPRLSENDDDLSGTMAILKYYTTII
jgi:hypothetical protein